MTAPTDRQVTQHKENPKIVAKIRRKDPWPSYGPTLDAPRA
jgi:hypothetical protein